MQERRRVLLKRYLPWLSILIWVGIVHIPTLYLYCQNSLDPDQFADDARNQVMPFHRYTYPQAFHNDFVGDYGLATDPALYRLVFMTVASLQDIEAFSKIVPLILLIVIAVSIARSSQLLAGKIAMWMSLTLVLGASVYLNRMAGALPRAFAFPLLALGIYSLLRGRVYWVGALMLLGAGFYPTAGVILALALTCYLLFLPSIDQGQSQDWTLKGRFIYLSGLALVMALVLAPTLWATAEYGPRIVEATMSQYPESGSMGTHGPEDRPPWKGFYELSAAEFKQGIYGAGQIWPWAKDFFAGNKLFDILLIVCALVWVKLWSKDSLSRRLGCFVLGAALSHLLARMFAPYFYAPSRFALYSLPLAAAVMLPVALVRGLESLSPLASRPRVLLGSQLLGCLLVLFAVGGAGSENTGLSIKLHQGQKEVYNYVRKLPPDTLVAGWPDETMSSLPWAGKKRAFMTGEIHMGYHQGFLDRVRERLPDFFDAYLARDPGPMIAFRDKYQVTHLLIEMRHFRGSDPGYMPPFSDQVKKLWKARRFSRDFEAFRQMRKAAVVRNKDYLLLDLSKIEAGPQVSVHR